MGRSTQNLERLAKAMGIRDILASQVSEMTRGVDKRVKKFRTSPLSEEYPFI